MTFVFNDLFERIGKKSQSSILLRIPPSTTIIDHGRSATNLTQKNPLHLSLRTVKPDVSAIQVQVVSTSQRFKRFNGHENAFNPHPTPGNWFVAQNQTMYAKFILF